MLKRLALYLNKRKEQFYEISYKTGATRADSWVDIEGGFGNLFANASLRKNFPNQTFHVDGDPIDLSRGGSFMGHHIMVPKRGVAIHINGQTGLNLEPALIAKLTRDRRRWWNNANA